MWIGFDWDLNEPFSEWKDLQTQVRQIEGASLEALEDFAVPEDVQTQINAAELRLRTARQAGSVHVLLGIGSALMVVLVCSIAVTYFIGTGRWCREVSEAYELDSEILSESQILKRGCVPWAIVGVLAALGISALGAASDPATGMETTARWVRPHLFAALAGICLIGYCLYSLWSSIVQNHRLVGRIMQEVRMRRMKAGLDSSEGETSIDAVEVGS